jgi:hypothetical protein
MSKKSKIWYGYLEAGTKSSPVLMDPKLDTANPNTLYLYNLKRDKILEYQRAIIEPKLRELNGKENDLAEELKKAFNKARKEFTPRRSSSKVITDTPAATTTKKAPVPDLEPDSIADDDIELGDDIEIDDDD